jgi:hypothetical protein
MKRRDRPQPPRHPSRRPPLGRSRLRTLLKWSGTLACLLILLAAAACLRWHSIRVSDGRTFYIAAVGGRMYVGWGPWVKETFYSAGTSVSPRLNTWEETVAYWTRQGPLWGIDRTDYEPDGGRLTFPLWMPLVLIGLPTGWLWWRDRRRVPAGCCACGYDLTGNVSGRCPECGALREAGTPEEVGRPKSEV